MTYEAWRCTFQSAEQAALAAYSRVEELALRVAELEANQRRVSDMVNNAFADGKAEGHGDATAEASVVIGELRARVAELESDLFAWRDKYMFQAGQFDSLKEVATKLAEERAEREEQKPVAYMRKWKFDGEEPKKERNESGKMAWPFKFKLHPVTVNRCLNDDIRLYAAPPVTEHGQVTVTTDESGRAVAVTRQDDEHRILSVIWEAPVTAPVRLTDKQIAESHANEIMNCLQDPCDKSESVMPMPHDVNRFVRAIETAVLRANGFNIDHPEHALELVGLRGCNSRHGGARKPDPCIYRMRTTDPGCTGCAERDEDQAAEAGGGK